MTWRRDILIGLGMAIVAQPALGQSLPLWAAAREPAGRDAMRDDAMRDADGPPARGQAVVRGGSPAPASPVAVQAGPPALSMEAVLAIVRRRFPGQLVGGPTRQGANGANYVVRWKTSDGHVIDVVVDAVTGAVRN